MSEAFLIQFLCEFPWFSKIKLKVVKEQRQEPGQKSNCKERSKDIGR